MERNYIYKLIINLIQKSGKNLLGLFSRYSFSFQFRKDEEKFANSKKLDFSHSGSKSFGLVRVFLLVVGIGFFANFYAQTVETFNTAGSNSWVCPAGITSVTVECWGAGGGGGNSNNSTGNGGGGGGGGAYSKRIITVVPGNTYYYSVGTGGTGAPGSSITAAVDGGNSWFNSSNSTPSSDLSSNVLAAGGKKGVNASLTGGGAGGTTANSYGSTKYAGGKGGNGASNGGGGGGGSAGTASNGNDGTVGNSNTDNVGGIAVTDGGSGGNGKGTYGHGGENGNSPGGGGGAPDDYASPSGGSGANGQVKLTYCQSFPATLSINGATAVPYVSYPTITAAIAALNGCGITQATVLELTSNYFSLAPGMAAENTATISLSNVTGQSATNTITIRPASGVTGKTLTSANTTAVFSFNGSDNWIIDGRPGGTGTSVDLIIQSTSTTSGATAVQFSSNATYNTIRYCNLKSTATGTTSGVVTFGTGSNSNNTITNCEIDGGAGSTAAPTNAARVGIYMLEFM
jgi:hypothetical protein